MSVEIIHGDQVMKSLLKGIDKVADAVKVTLGPRGRNVVIYEKQNLQGAEWSDRPVSGAKAMVMNDGVTIAKSIILPDPFENMGAEIVKEAASKANESAGDGTTTATVLTQAILHEGFKAAAAGYNPVFLRRGIERAVSEAEKELAKLAKPVHTEAELSQVAAISCADRELGNMIGEALHRIGEEGVVEVNDMGQNTTSLDIREGIYFNRGYMNEFMINDKERQICELHNPYILMTDVKIESSREILDILIAAAEDGRDLLIICDDMAEEPMGILMRNKTEGDMDIAVIKAPMYGDGRRWRLDDLAVQTGGTFISDDLKMKLKDAVKDDLGTCEYVKITKYDTLIMGGGGDPEKIAGRVNELRYLVENTDYEFNRDRHKERLAKFVSGVAVISVGGTTEVELKERKLRIEDAVNAAKAARKEGVVPGGGTALMDIIPPLRRYCETLDGEEKLGAEIFIRALTAPLRQIAENCGKDGAAVAAAVTEMPRGTGYNGETGEYADMFTAGIIDPAMVTRIAMEAAASVSATLLTAGGIVGPHAEPGKTKG